MKAISAPLTAVLLASFALAAAPAFAQEGGFGGSGSHKTTSQGSSRLKAPTAQQLKAEKAAEERKAKAEAAAKAKADGDKNKGAQTVATQAASGIVIDTSSSYEDALVCYQYYGVTMQIANALKARQGLAASQVAQYDAVAHMANYQQQIWFKRIGDVNGDKKVEEMNADLQKVAGGIITDANAGLGGDAAAQERNAAAKAKCHGFEKPAAGGTPPPA